MSVTSVTDAELRWAWTQSSSVATALRGSLQGMGICVMGVSTLSSRYGTALDADCVVVAQQIFQTGGPLIRVTATSATTPNKNHLHNTLILFNQTTCSHLSSHSCKSLCIVCFLSTHSAPNHPCPSVCSSSLICCIALSNTVRGNTVLILYLL